MAQEIASAYVTLLPSARGIGKGIEEELGGSFDSATRKGESSIKGMFSRVTGLAVAAGGVIAGAFGLSKIFGGGMARLMGIEEAQAKLRGLGNDAASVEVIMANALAAVKGTSFGMAEAATTAAGAVAAGIKPGEDLERVLKSVSNSAAAAGVGMDEMGSIYNKVASLGKAQNDVLQQVADRGIPIYQALADQLGVTTDEVFKMASQGKISFAEFEEAMTTASGTVAEEMGTTLKGSIANLNASLSRIGANFLSGVFPLLAPAIQKLTEWLGGVEEVAKDIGVAFGEWVVSAVERVRVLTAGVQGIIDLFRGDFTPALREAFGWEEDSGIVAVILRVGDGVRGLRDLLNGEFTEAVRSAFGWEEDSRAVDFLISVGDAVRDLQDILSTEGIQGLIDRVADWLSSGGVQKIASALLEGRALVMGAAVALLGMIAEALPVILPEIVDAITNVVIPGIVASLEALLPEVASLIETLLPPLVGAFVGLIDGLAGALSVALPQIVDALAEVLPGILTVVLGLLPSLIDAAVTLFLGLVDGLTAALPAVLAAITDAIPLLIDAIVLALPQLVDGAILLFEGIIEGLTVALPDIIQAVADIIPVLVDAMLLLAPQIVDGAIQLFLAINQGLADAMPEILAALAAAVTQLWESIDERKPEFVAAGLAIIGSIITGIIDSRTSLAQSIAATVMGWVLAPLESAKPGISQKGREWIESLDLSVRGAWTALGEWFAGMGERVKAAIGATNTVLLRLGLELINGFRDGVLQRWIDLKAWLSGMGERVKGAFSNASSWLWSSGRAIIQGLIDGVKSMTGAAGEAVSGVLSYVRQYLPFSPAKLGPFSGKGWTLYSGKAIVSALAEGMRSERDWLERATQGVLAPVQASLAGVDVAVAAAAPAQPSGPSLVQHNYGVDAKELADRNRDQWDHWTTANRVTRR